MENVKLIDSESRKKIIRKIDENFFVEAGAGSGKTTMLVERMVAMVESGIDISKISAITFTKAAANEFYARFQKRLIERINESEINYKEKDNKLLAPTEITKQRCKEALQNIDLCFMGTIDSFCNMVMSEHPREGLIPSDSKIVSDDELEIIYKDVYKDILNGKYENLDLINKANAFLRFHSYPQDAFINILKVFIEHRDAEIQIPPYKDVDIDEKYAVLKKDVCGFINKICDHPEILTASNVKKLEEVKASFIRFKNTFNQRSWNKNISYVLKAFEKTILNSDFRLIENAEEILGPSICHVKENEGTGKWLVIDENDLPVKFKEIYDLQYNVSIDFINEVRKIVLEKTKNKGALTFSDYLFYLRDTLKEDILNGSKLINHIYKRHSYFLIDEFQDTDPVQAEIFFYLTSKNSDASFEKCIPHKGSLFIVGDPKQSIYRFKNADVSSFLKVKKLFENGVGEVLNLYCNFRSSYEIKKYFNDTFKTLLKDENEEPLYVEIPNDISEKKKHLEGVFYYDSPRYGRDEDIVSETILKLINNDNYLIPEKVDDKIIYRKIDYKDFMIITPAKKALAYYANAFTKLGIPYMVEGNISFSESTALKSLVCIFGSISNPNDNRLLYATLKLPLFNISEKELIEAKENNYRLDIKVIPEESKVSKKLYKAIKILNDYYKESLTIDSSILFNKLIETSDVFKYDGDDNLEYVYFALEILKTKEDSKEIISHKEAYEYLNKILSSDNDLERCLGLLKSGNQVHLANLHKIKGLEAPVVILAHPDKKKKDASFKTERNEDGNKGYLFNVTQKFNEIYIPVIKSDYYKKYQDMENLSIEEESLRLIYVAATRAKNVLIISRYKAGNGNTESNPWNKLLNKVDTGEMKNIQNFLSKDEKTNPHHNQIEYDSLEKTENTFIKYENSLMKQTYKIKTPSSNEELEEIKEVQYKAIEESSGDNEATILGSMVHELMEAIVSSRNNLNIDDYINYLLEKYNSDSKGLLMNVYHTITNGGYPQKSDVPKDILNEILKAEELYTEVPFTYKENDVIWNGIIDFLYKKDGEYHIIDYKTNRNDEGLDEHYKPQLDAYKKALKEIKDIDVKDAYIYHISIK